MSHVQHTGDAQKITIPPRHEQATRKRTQKNKGIVIFTISICLSCLYLETQICYPFLNDRKAFYMALLTYLDVFMCLWSYIQTIRIKNKVVKLRGATLIPNESENFFDHAYGITQKRCEICDYHKLSRVSHCSTCGECVYKLDHHCIWTQTCIGISNQKSFYLFCLYMSIGVLQFWYFTVRVMRERNLPILKMIEPGVAIIWGITAFSALFVGIMIIMLLISHTLMILTNYRTIDSMKTGKICPMPFISREKDPNFINLHDRGEIQNFKEIFGDNWLLWLIPLKREILNEFFVEKMAPHPDKQSLMRDTDLFEVENKYRKYMQLLSDKVASLFIGKKMRVNDEVFIIQAQE